MKTLIDKNGAVVLVAESIYADVDGVYRTADFRVGSCVAGDGCRIVDGVIEVQPEPVPASVTMRQARLALLGAGKLALVDAAIDAQAEPLKSAARIEWEYSNEVQRNNGIVSMMGPALGLTSDQIDDLFRVAATL